MVLVALTGGIGSGKSTVAAALEKRGAVIVDSDKVAREIVEPGAVAYEALRERFGEGVFLPDGHLNRPALADLVFKDPTELAALNAITHPLITAEVASRAAAALTDPDAVVVIDAPLLTAEAAMGYGVAGVIVVETPPDTAVARLVEHRGFSEADARARVAAQMTVEERRKFASRIVDNSGDREALEAQIEDVWKWIQAGAGGAS